MTGHRVSAVAAKVGQMSTALYRRYRPETFTDVIGQEHVTVPLMQSLRTGRVNHAYLFSGPRGCGKTTSARILARCLNCEQGPTAEPCGVCESCVALSRGGPGTVDVIEIDAASHGGVDDARDLRERASYGPAQSRYKVYIIDEAHMVTPQGFNALLKIVEEPPEHVKFVFATTEPEKVIGTIRSRTHHYPFRLVPPAQLTDYMERLCEQEGVTVAPGVLGFVTRAGGGSVRDSLSVLDQLIAGSGEEGLTYAAAAALLGFTDAELLDATIDALAAGDGAAVFTQIDKVVESGHDPRRFVEDLLERFRDLIIVAAVPEGAASVLRGVPEDQLERMRGQQARFGPGALSRAADIANAGLTEMTGATSPRLHLELICARILLPGASGPTGYAARLDRLERRLEVGGAPAPAATPAHTPPRAAEPRPVASRPLESRPLESRAVESRAVESGPVESRATESRPVESGAPESSGAAGPAGPAGPAVTVGPTSAGSPRETSASQPQTDPTPTAPTDPTSAGSSAPPEPDPTGPADSGGGLDAAALRRVWPDVLARVFTMRRATWTFLSQHAQVLDYDGTVLTLGIATTGLANTFRQGNHSELVRQALIDEIGVDARVEGVPRPEGGPPRDGGPGSPPASPPPSTPPPATPAPATPAPSTQAPATPSSTRPAPAGHASTSSAMPSRPPSGSTPPADWGSASAPAPEWATAPAAPPEHRPPRPERGGAAGHTPARTPAPARASTRIDEVSGDDEEVVPSGATGRQVVERLLGGQVIEEITE